MLPTFQYKQKLNINQPLFHSTNSDLLIEGLQNPYPRSPAYFSMSKGFAYRNFLDFHPNNIGPKRIISYSLKKIPLLYDVDDKEIDINDLKLYFQKKGLIFDEKANDDFKRKEDVTQNSVLKLFGKKFSPIISKYFANYDGLIENDMIVLFNPSDILELESIVNIDNKYLALLELLNIIETSSNIYETTLSKISNKYGIKDINILKYLLSSNASKLNTEVPNVQILNKKIQM
jgi:hypothetical protein